MVQQIIARMPLPNDFSGIGLFPANTIDGLNTPMPYLHRMVTTSLRVSTGKARHDLAWKPAYPTMADGLPG